MKPEYVNAFSLRKAAGPNGEDAPGFPKDGKWVVRHENIKGW